MGTAKNEFFRLPRKTANAHFIRGFGDAEKFFCTYLTQSDDLGRVVIPVEMRRVLDMGEREALSISLENNAIVLRRAHAGCVFCGSGKDVMDFRGKLVCPRCARQLATVQATAE